MLYEVITVKMPAIPRNPIRIAGESYRSESIAETAPPKLSSEVVRSPAVIDSPCAVEWANSRCKPIRNPIARAVPNLRT